MLHGVKVLDGFGTCHITVMAIFCVVYYLEIYISLMKFVGDLCGLQLLACSMVLV